MADQTRQVVGVDARWQGPFGIGRYSLEVLRRLTLPWLPLRATGKPSAPWSSFQLLPGHPRARLAYSPGYNVMLQAPRQILTVHDLIHLQNPSHKARLHRAYYERLVKPSIRSNRVVLTVSETSRSAILDWLQDSNVRVINAGIGASEAFQPSPTGEEVAPPYALYVGNLRAHKNFEIAVRAVAQIPDLFLRALVPPHDKPQAQAIADRHGLGARFELLPNLTDSELASHYQRAATTLMPSIREGFGLPALESIRCGTPVVYYSGCSAVAETVGARGARVESSDDAAEWADVILGVVGSGMRVTPPEPQEYDWDRTAALVDRTLREYA